MKKDSHQELLEAVSAITETRTQDFTSIIAAIVGDEKTPPNYSRALRILCTAKGDDEFLDLIQLLAETLLAYQNSLDIRINEKAGASQKAAIHYAAIGGNKRLYDLLVQHGGDPKLKDVTETTAEQYFATATRAKTLPETTPPTQTNSAPANPVDGFIRTMTENMLKKTPLASMFSQPGAGNQLTDMVSAVAQQYVRNQASQDSTGMLQQFLSGDLNPQQLAMTQQLMPDSTNVVNKLFSPESLTRLASGNDQDVQAMTREFTQEILTDANASRQQMGMSPVELPTISTEENTKVPEGDLDEVRAELISDLTLAAENTSYDLDAFWHAINHHQYVDAIRAAIKSQNVDAVSLIKELLGYQQRLGFSVNTQDPVTGCTPLHESITHRDSLELYMIMIAHGGDSITIRNRAEESASDLKRAKFASAYESAQGNPSTFIDKLGLNTNNDQQPQPPLYQAPQDSPLDGDTPSYYVPPHSYGQGK